jgi:hypothetical protein
MDYLARRGRRHDDSLVTLQTVRHNFNEAPQNQKYSLSRLQEVLDISCTSM